MGYSDSLGAGRGAVVKILVTGSEGFIGKHLCRKLSALGHELCEVDLVIESDAAQGVWYRKFKPEIVIHLAAQTSVRRSIEYPKEDASKNILTTIATVTAAKEAGAKRFIFASSGGAIYGEGHNLTEVSSIEPTTPYGLSKLTCEKYLEMLHGSMDLTILRLSNVYGPDQKGGESGVIPIFIKAKREGRRPTIYGNGLQTRDYVHVSDVCDAFVKAIEGPYGVYNIGTGREASVKALYMMIGGRGDYLTAPLPRGEAMMNSLDCTRARLDLGWNPSVTLEDGIAELLK